MRHHAIAVASGFGDLALCRQESDRPAFVARLETLHQEHPTPAADFQKEQASLGLATPKRVEALANLAGSSLLRARFEWAEVFGRTAFELAESLPEQNSALTKKVCRTLFVGSLFAQDTGSDIYRLSYGLGSFEHSIGKTRRLICTSTAEGDIANMVNKSKMSLQQICARADLYKAWRISVGLQNGTSAN